MNNLKTFNSPSARLLDVVRGVAALLVVLGHSRDISARVSGLNHTGDSFFEMVLLVPSSFAVEAVAVFFVLSGYLVGGQVIRQNREGRFRWGEFLIKRLSRLWAVLIPGLFITYISWLAMTHLSPQSYTLAENSTLPSALCNVLFLQESWCDSYLINSSLWSLSYEFWFYIIFTSLITALYALFSQSWTSVILNTLVVFLSIAIFGTQVLLLIPAWLLGVGISLVAEKPNMIRDNIRSKAYTWLMSSLVLLMFSFFLSNHLHLDRTMLTLTVSIPSALVILSITQIEHEIPLLRRPIDIGANLGKWSFSIYVFHLPIVKVLLTLAHKQELINLFGLPIMTYSIVLVTLPLTWLMWWLTERHTNQLRDTMFTIYNTKK
ncbi:MAG: acyltransferase [Moritella sp.]|uniref:acyltransferase family protein n=1 Tax=Moritella sp. TaxID=78556 RepID=UPI0025FDA3E3|nr:acyltransferase [Moritella sp.]NQZ92646.1 acyltransferase [Moritella sp.]